MLSVMAFKAFTQCINLALLHSVQNLTQFSLFYDVPPPHTIIWLLNSFLNIHFSK